MTGASAVFQTFSTHEKTGAFLSLFKTETDTLADGAPTFRERSYRSS